MTLETEFTSTMGDVGEGMSSLIEETLPATILLVVGMGIAYAVLYFMRQNLEHAHKGN